MFTISGIVGDIQKIFVFLSNRLVENLAPIRKVEFLVVTLGDILDFKKIWPWVMSIIVTVLFAAGSWALFNMASNAVLPDSGVSANEAALVVGTLTVLGGVVPGVIVLLICAAIARRRSLKKPLNVGA